MIGNSTTTTTRMRPSIGLVALPTTTSNVALERFTRSSYRCRDERCSSARKEFGGDRDRRRCCCGGLLLAWHLSAVRGSSSDTTALFMAGRRKVPIPTWPYVELLAGKRIVSIPMYVRNLILSARLLTRGE